MAKISRRKRPALRSPTECGFFMKTDIEIVNKKLKAKAYPIEKLYPWELKRSGTTLIGRCPLHLDNNPSFAIYTATNSFNCFAGCGGGDSITFLMKLYSVGFKEAVERLNR